jgi:hypothetical protein
MERKMPEFRTFEVKKNDLSAFRVAAAEVDGPGPGEVIAKVDRFALTANNITYGVVGERIGYWRFFPASEESYGVIPVWGYANVTHSRCAEIEKGERLFGYFPMGARLVLKPDRIRPERLVDGAAHRAELPPVYNSYARVAAEGHFDPAMEDERILLFPLYATSYCLYDCLVDNGWFGAGQLIVASASSKTAIGLGYAVKADPASPRLVALTSKRNLEKVTALGLYDEIRVYEDLASIDRSKASVIVDMSGDGKILAALHAHLGDNMRFTSNVGVTHYEAAGMGQGFIRERSAMFFAPGHIQKRAQDWGPGVFEKKAFAFWKDAAVKSRSWLRIERVRGMKGLESAYLQVLKGESSPDAGIIVEL